MEDAGVARVKVNQGRSQLRDPSHPIVDVSTLQSQGAARGRTVTVAEEYLIQMSSR